MEGRVPAPHLLVMGLGAVVCFIAPLVLSTWLGRRNRFNLRAFIVGALMFFLFALILERVASALILGRDPTASPIYQNVWVFMVYGGLMAGVFEETARLVGYRILRASSGDSYDTALSYGDGHGGLECILMGAVAYVNALTASFYINSGRISQILGKLPEAQREVYVQSLQQLISQHWSSLLWGTFERLIALVIQIALSVIVFHAIKTRQFRYFLLAVLLHAIVDFPAVLYQRGILTSIPLLEFAVAIIGGGIAYLAYRLATQTSSAC
ncbi:YhfC family intramembrane metalloprotease [Coprothermobacteraceae bacterium]|nr:YhfC family intramembrane metalloprotease [Coprothermobacteraceae bacterium]